MEIVSEYFFPSSEGKTLIHVNQWTPVGREIIGVYDRHTVDGGFQFTVLVGMKTGDKMVRCIADDIYVRILSGDVIERFCDIIRQHFFIDDLTVPAVCDPSAVKGQDITPEFMETKQFGKRSDAFGGPSACQNNFFSMALNID